MVLTESSTFKHFALDIPSQPTISLQVCVNYLILTWLEVVNIISTDAPYLSDFQHEKRLLSGSDKGERMDGRKNKASVISFSLFPPAEAFLENYLSAWPSYWSDLFDY